jgi:flagella synthesis protein FlgN
LAQIAQKISHSNGLIISTRLQHNQRAFAALHCAAGNISLYGPKGQAYI